MDEDLKKKQTADAAPDQDKAPEGTPEPETASAGDTAPKDTAPENGTASGKDAKAPDPLEEAQAKLKTEHEQYLRLAAEYDNYRKRSQKEKDNIYRDAKAATVEKFLPVYDNLSRALDQDTPDAAYKKGVEMTMTGLLEILKKLDVETFGEPGDTFSPELHNAVMHIEDSNYKEGQIVEVFQKGFKLGDKVIRFAMVQTAN